MKFIPCTILACLFATTVALNGCQSNDNPQNVAPHESGDTMSGVGGGNGTFGGNPAHAMESNRNDTTMPSDGHNGGN